MINFGIIGCGEISAARYNAIKASEDVSLLAICDTNKERLKEARERYNVSVAYRRSDLGSLVIARGVKQNAETSKSSRDDCPRQN